MPKSKVLYIHANPKSEKDSVSLSVGRNFINSYKKKNPSSEIIELDLFKTPLTLIDSDVMDAWGKLMRGKSFDSLNDIQKKKLGDIDKICSQFINADKYVFAAPLWNFNFPPQMKMYIDNILITGKTFKYTDKGPVGLLKDKNKKALIVVASGGVYSNEVASSFDHGAPYLKSVLSFIGIDDVKIVRAEGTNMFPQKLDSIRNDACKEVDHIANDF